MPPSVPKPSRAYLEKCRREQAPAPSGMNREGGDGFFEAGTPGRGTPPACCYNIWMCLSPKTGFTFTNNDGDFFYNGPQKPLGACIASITLSHPLAHACLPMPQASTTARPSP